MNVRIDYYTGTGGSERVAKRIAEELTDKGCSVKVNRIKRDEFVSDDSFEYYVLVFAVHSFNAPRPPFEWTNQIEGKNRKCAVISVSGGGEVLSNTACRRKIIHHLESRNFDVVYEDMVRMPNNWMSVPKKEKFDRLLRNYPLKTREIARAIVELQKRRKSPYWIDLLISAMGESEKKVLKKFGEGIITLDHCTGCGICANNCCSSNIVIENGKALVGDRCDMCLGCIYGCPHNALTATYGGYQVDKRGYNLKAMERDLL